MALNETQLGGVDRFVRGKERAFLCFRLPTADSEKEVATFGHRFGTIMCHAICRSRIRMNPNVSEIASHLTPEPFG